MTTSGDERRIDYRNVAILTRVMGGDATLNGQLSPSEYHGKLCPPQRNLKSKSGIRVVNPRQVENSKLRPPDLPTSVQIVVSDSFFRMSVGLWGTKLKETIYRRSIFDL